MTAASKIRILFLVTALISVPIALLDVLPVRILFGVIILLHYVYFIFFVKTASKEEISERRRETGEQAKG
jgi:uncharacterized membrane protein YbaN (DUF454 family)